MTSSVLDRCKILVDDLYAFRDHYFENHNFDEAAEKDLKVHKQMEIVLAELESLQDSAEQEDKTKFYFYKGKALNIVPDYKSEVEDLLAKAIKLNPHNTEAWNEMGENFWKKNDIQTAKDCFESALKHEKNKVSLRNLSIVLRQLPENDGHKKIENIEEGLKYAKEAVNMDTYDGQSWSILGNAYLSVFFVNAQNPQTIALCMSSYEKAESDPVTMNSPDLYYNKAIAMKYADKYESSLKAFNRALELDPVWTDPKNKVKNLLNHLTQVNDLVKSRGKHRGRKLKDLVETIPVTPTQYTKLCGSTMKVDLQTVNKLSLGTNKNCVLVGKVVCSIVSDEKLPFTFCIVDREETCVAVNLYNLAEGKGVIIGDCICINDPNLSRVQFSFSGNKFDFPLIRVESPLLLLVNGKRLGKEWQAGTQLSTFHRT